MGNFVPLNRAVFEHSADVVAPALLGKWLLRRSGDALMGGIIVETEAYLANDPACHAFRGQTARNAAMFGPPGHAYVYFIYGCHYCVNAVCGPVGTGEAVLIRALEPTVGLDRMRKARPAGDLRTLLNGPAKLCQALDITRGLDGTDLCSVQSPLFIAHAPPHTSPTQQRIASGPRIGISKAQELPLRFFLEGSAFVSRARKT